MKRFTRFLGLLPLAAAAGCATSDPYAAGRTARKFVAAALLTLLSSGLSPAQGKLDPRPQNEERVTLSGRVPRFLSRSIQIALEEAVEQLHAHKCRTVFLDFTDRAGRRLSENLEATGLSGSEYLRRIRFGDGTGKLPCERTDVIAFTVPGSRAVSVCGRRFAEWVRRDRRFAANILIHEGLHSLGLGGDPPSSQEITSRVVAKCGS